MNRCPPRPKIVAAGARRRISTASAPAYKSPEGSPQEIMIFTSVLLEIGRSQIELIEADELVPAEARLFELVLERGGVAHQHNSEAAGIEIHARHALHVRR